MAFDPSNADTIIAEIDANRLRPMLLAVVRKLHNHMRLTDPLQLAILSAFDRGEDPATMKSLQDQLWPKIMALSPSAQSGLRLSICMTRSDESVGWELGEYLILWARQQGLSENQIIDAFR